MFVLLLTCRKIPSFEVSFSLTYSKGARFFFLPRICSAALDSGLFSPRPFVLKGGKGMGSVDTATLKLLSTAD